MGNLFSVCGDLCDPSGDRDSYEPVPENVIPSQPIPAPPPANVANPDDEEELRNIVKEASRRMVRVQEVSVENFEEVLGCVEWKEGVEPIDNGFRGEFEGELVENL